MCSWPLLNCRRPLCDSTMEIFHRLRFRKVLEQKLTRSLRYPHILKSCIVIYNVDLCEKHTNLCPL